MGILNLAPLRIQVAQDARANALRLVRQPLAVAQPLRGPLQPVRPAQQLLPLVHDGVTAAPGTAAAAAAAEEGGAVAVLRELEQRGAGDVEVVRVVAEAGFDLVSERGGDVGELEGHLANLELLS